MCSIVSLDLTTVRSIYSVVGLVAEWFRHATGNLEIRVQFPAAPHFRSFA